MQRTSLKELHDFEVETQLYEPTNHGRVQVLLAIQDAAQLMLERGRIPTQIWITWKEWGDDSGEVLNVSAKAKIRSAPQDLRIKS